MPVNDFAIDALRGFGAPSAKTLRLERPTGSAWVMTPDEVADDLAARSSRCSCGPMVTAPVRAVGNRSLEAR